MPARTLKKASKSSAKRPGRAGSRRRPAPGKRARATKAAKPARKRRPSAKRPRSTARARSSSRRARPARQAAARAVKRQPRATKKQTAKAARARAKAQLDKQREKARRDKEREKERLTREREKARLLKERERQKREAAREKALLAKERTKELQRRAKERERQLQEREKEKQRQKVERARLERERKEALAKKLAEREAVRVAAASARDEEKARQKAEREDERQRKLAERDAAREEARRQKEEERARREAEREAYRKAKEAERERLRAEREAARRALEGKVARATKRAQRLGGLGRGSTTRVYRPDAIPNQSGTTRRGPTELIGVRILTHARPAEPPPAPPAEYPEDTTPHFPQSPEAVPQADEAKAPTPPPPAPPQEIDERWRIITERLTGTTPEFQREYAESFDMSWIYHDSALEGVVYTFQELKTAIDPNIAVVPDSSLQPVCEEIRRHKTAIELVRDIADKKRVPINVDVIKRIYLTLHPEEGDLKTVKYRKDIPQHRLYFHEYAQPDKIAYKVRQVVDWLNGPEPKKIKSPIRIAARAHYDLLRVFPFATDSGKVARLFMNLLLLRSGYPPAIIHSTERQRYYEALKGSLPTIVNMVNEAILNALQSIEKRLDELRRGS
jgi:hypothetical protein